MEVEVCMEQSEIESMLNGYGLETAELICQIPDCQSAFNCDPYRRPILPPPCGTERQLGRSRSWTSSRGRSIPSYLCKLSLVAFPSLHEEKEFSQPDGGGKLGRRYPSWRVNVARFSTYPTIFTFYSHRTE